eukprot:2821642-Pleurochrysis_carterae.AAC.1
MQNAHVLSEQHGYGLSEITHAWCGADSKDVDVASSGRGLHIENNLRILSLHPNDDLPGSRKQDALIAT